MQTIGVIGDVEEIENVWIPMSDGCRIAARIWLPRSARSEPVPAILECIPYRKRDFTRGRDEPIHGYFARNGYAAVRVDVRGSGDSDGVLCDEYSWQEHEDALEIIAWIAAQPWCAGAVGMMGISWGGFNSLQVAALAPKALKAIITLCSTDDRYADDAHYMGGCLLNENMQWGSVLLNHGAYPPDPQIVGDRWRAMWRERIDDLVPFPALWMQHQRRDDYWKHGSVCEDYGAIRCAVYAIGGWADGYSNAIPRLLAGLKCPKKGLIGPWAHLFPHDGVPGPAIGFLQEAVRWWDQWLRGVDTGIMDEPPLRVWMQENVAPLPYYDERPGRWVAEETWPSPRIAEHTFHLDPDGLAAQPGPREVLSFASPQTTGRAAGEWCGFGGEGEMPADQRPDDGRSFVFDSAPLPERLEILGAPVVEVEVAADRPTALLAVRLCAVQPDGVSSLVTYGVLNLTHRDGHEWPEPLEPGTFYRGARAAQRHRACVSGRLPHPARALERVLADRVAVAAGGAAVGAHRAERAAAAGAAAARRGCEAAAVRAAGRGTEQPAQDPAPAADAARRRGRPGDQRDGAYGAHGRVRRGADPDRADRHGPRLHVPQAPPDRRDRPPVRPDRDPPEDHHAAHGLGGARRMPQPSDRDGREFSVRRRPRGVRGRSAVRPPHLASGHPAPAGLRRRALPKGRRCPT